MALFYSNRTVVLALLTCIIIIIIIIIILCETLLIYVTCIGNAWIHEHVHYCILYTREYMKGINAHSQKGAQIRIYT